QAATPGNGVAKTPAADEKRTPAKAEKTEKRKRKFAYRKVEDLEKEIFDRETRIEALHQEMGQESTLRDGERVRRVQNELAEQQAALAKLYEHWEEATELN